MILTKQMKVPDALDKVQKQLLLAGEDEKAPFRFFVLSTISKDVMVPASRMVVLRSFTDQWEFEFFTDARSRKVEEIERAGSVSALFWDPAEKLQVRIQADAQVHHRDKRTAERWESVTGEARKAYNSIMSPGEPVSDPSVAHQWPEKSSDSHFGVVRCKARQVSALQLSGAEHIAFRFSRKSGAAEWQGGWIVP